MVLVNQTRGVTLAADLRRAHSFGRRLRGLMFRRGLAPGEALWLRPCRSVHTHFMRFPIDVLFVDASLRVVRVVRAMAP